MAQIASEDYENLRIYLHVDTVTSGFNPTLMHREHRTRRRLNANGERKFDPMVTFSGNESIGGGKFTPTLVKLRTGVRIIPYDTPHSLDILNQIVNIEDGISDRGVFDRISVVSNVDIDSTYSPVEIREIEAITSAVLPGDITAISAAVWDEAIASHLGVGSTGEALSDAGAAADVGAIADAVWDEPIADHQIVGSTGEELASVPSLDLSSIADAVWDESAAGHLIAGSVGESLSSAAEVVVDISGIADAVWDEPIADHLVVGSVGEELASVPSIDTASIADAVWDEDRGAGTFSDIITKSARRYVLSDNMVFNANKMMVSARERVFASKAAADAATPDSVGIEGAIEVYDVVAVEGITPGLPVSYSKIRTV